MSKSTILAAVTVTSAAFVLLCVGFVQMETVRLERAFPDLAAYKAEQQAAALKRIDQNEKQRAKFAHASN